MIGGGWFFLVPNSSTPGGKSRIFCMVSEYSSCDKGWSSGERPQLLCLTEFGHEAQLMYFFSPSSSCFSYARSLRCHEVKFLHGEMEL